MAESRSDPDLYNECLAAMVVSGDAYPCDTLAPVQQAECALPAAPTATALPDHPAAALTGQTERT